MAERQNLLPRSLPGRMGLVLLLVILAGFAGFLGYRLGETPSQVAQVSTGRAAIGGPFTLVDQGGQTVTEQDLLGNYALIYFGYTYCPDVCPTALATAARGLDLLEAADPQAAQMVRPVFITVDPERDTPEAMGEYVAAFHPRMLGLTGTEAQVAKAAKSYRVFYQKVFPEDATEYLMDHASNIYLMDPAGNYTAHFPHNMTADEVSERLQKLVSAPQS